MRIAFLGPRLDYGGATYVGVQFLRELALGGDTVDCYFSRPVDDIPVEFLHDGLTFLGQNMQRRRPKGGGPRGFLLRQLQRVQREEGALDDLCAEHASRPYDVLWVFSRAEFLGVRRRLSRLPPVVIHPETHARGESRWHRLERPLALRGESIADYGLSEAMLSARSLLQSSDLRKADRVVAPSERFARYLVNDCGVPRGRISVVWNPVDLTRFSPREHDLAAPPVRLAFISRIAVRKGVEQIVELSHRLVDLEGRVDIAVLGKPNPWSNYMALLDDLDGRIAHYEGRLSGESMGERYRQLHGLIMPSHYEPFGLTAVEALASGLPIVASDEVGAVEGLASDLVTVYPAGDTDALESSVRRLVDMVESGDRQELGRQARRLAEDNFDPSVLVGHLRKAFEVVAR